jgi:dTDP-4-amino-4,6-dideoxygalactose transaminase
LANLYQKGLSDLPDLKLPPPPQSDSRFFDVYQNFVIRSQKRDKLVAYLRESGVEVLVSWPKPLHRHEALGLGKFHLPKTERVSNEVLSLPMYPELSDEQVEYVIEAIHNFYKEMP